MTMKIEFSEDMVSVLKGAPLSCLVLLLIARTPLSAQYLERRTRYSDKLVHAALLLLEERCLITRNGRYAWQIAVNGLQLPLATALLQEDSSPAEPEELENLTAGHGISDSDTENLTAGHGISDSDTEFLRLPGPSSTRSIDLTSKELIDLPLLGQRDTEFLRVRENLAECDRFGIGEPKRSALGRMKHVTAKLIRYHCSTVHDVALAIWRIEHGWKIKAGWVDPGDLQNYCPDKAGIYAQTVDEVKSPDVCAQTLEEIQALENVKEAVRTKLRRVDFDTWLKSAELAGVDGDGWTLRVGNSPAAAWIREYALVLLEEAAGVKIKVVW
ncbi:MAG: hypothetical protein C0401_06570 [Anaerolinea sp.]|nr:hypothetical protein [Anaerolinea sp.]